MNRKYIYSALLVGSKPSNIERQAVCNLVEIAPMGNISARRRRWEEAV